jgi:putative transcriptional regulator
MRSITRLKRLIAGDISLSENPGRVMRKWRELFHIPQILLAEVLGISPSVISDYESGRRQSPGSRTIKRFVEAIIALDSQNESQVVNAFQRLMSVEIPTTIIRDISEFPQPLSAKMFLDTLRADIVACHELLPDRELKGYLVADNRRALQKLSSDGYLKLFQASTQRALVITNVSTGRSPMIALQSELKPSLLVLQGVEHTDYLVVDIAEKERVPLGVTKIDSVETLIRRLQTLRHQTEPHEGEPE